MNRSHPHRPARTCPRDCLLEEIREGSKASRFGDRQRVGTRSPHTPSTEIRAQRHDLCVSQADRENRLHVLCWSGNTRWPERRARPCQAQLPSPKPVGPSTTWGRGWRPPRLRAALWGRMKGVLGTLSAGTPSGVSEQDVPASPGSRATAKVASPLNRTATRGSERGPELRARVITQQ